MDLIQAGAKTVRSPGSRDSVYKDECMLSFDTPESPCGLYTSLNTWRSHGRDYVEQDFLQHRNPLYLKQVWRRVAKPEQPAPMDEEANGSSALPSKLALNVDGGFKTDSLPYDVVKYHFVVAFPKIDHEVPALDNPALPEAVAAAVTAVLAHDGVSKAAQLAAAWEEDDLKVSRYANDIPFVDTGKKISLNPKDWVCEESGMTDNLWLNLSTGHIGSGRPYFDGSGGTGAALKHYEETGRKYPLAVKLGTITPHGADVYSYAADEDSLVLDPHLEEHLARWGIDMKKQEKTDKTMTELQIESNATFEWDKLTESGADLVKLAGPGYVGLENLGNSCYMNSILQIVFALPTFKRRYVDNAADIIASAPADPQEDLITMLSKVGVGILSDRYARGVKVYESVEKAQSSLCASSTNATDIAKFPFEPSSVRPLAFKSVIGKGHYDFSNAQQQDAGLFFQHFLEKVLLAERTGSSRVQGGETDFVPSAALFQFEIEDRIQCDQSGKVRYVTRTDNALLLPIPVEAATNKQLVDEYEQRKQKKQKMDDASTDDDPVKLHVPFEACIESYGATEVVDDFLSSATGSKGTAQKRTRIRSFPEFLIVRVNRYLQEGLSSKKMDVFVPMPESLDLEHLRGSGVSSEEELLPDTPVADPNTVACIVAMGFSENGATRAALATGNTNPDAAVHWAMEHAGDPDFNDPIVAEAPDGSGASTSSAPDASKLSGLTSMGFSVDQAAAAFKATNGNLDRAADWLITHMDDLDSAVAAENSKEDASVIAAKSPRVDGPGSYDLVGFASHMGSNLACGHYVAHVKKDGRFVLYNDEKVAVSQSPPLGYGFIYLYARKPVQ